MPRAAASLLLVMAVLAGCGGGDEDAATPGKVRTTDAGTVIISGTSSPAGLEVEAQDSSLYAKPTARTPKDLLGQALGASCKLDPPADQAGLGTIPLLWREEFGDWGAAPFGYDMEKLPNLARVIRSCELRRGVRTGNGDEVDLGAGEPLGSVRFR